MAIKIINNFGAVIFEEENPSTFLKLELKNQGMYFVNIQTKEGFFTRKIIVH